MKRRVFMKTAGVLLFIMAFAVEGMMLERVQGSAPVSVIARGNVSAILAEPGAMGVDSPEKAAVQIERVEPGQVIRREPTVCMGGESEQAYLRARILVSGLPEEKMDELLSGLILPVEWNFNRQDGYYYYKNLVSPGQRIPVFKGICIPKRWRETDGFQIDVTVEVVEAAGITPVLDSECRMTGWILAE